MKTTHLNLERQKEDRQVLAEAKESYFSRYVEKNGESAFESPPNDSGIQLRRVYSAQDQRGDYVNALSSFSRSSALRMEKELSSSSSLVHEEEQLQGELPNIEDRHPISGNISEANGLFPSVTNGVDYAGHDVPSSLDLSADSTNVDGARSGREEFRPTNHKVVAHVSILMEAELGNAKKLLNTDRTDSAPIRRLKQVNDYLQVFLRFGLALSEVRLCCSYDRLILMSSIVESGSESYHGFCCRNRQGMLAVASIAAANVPCVIRLSNLGGKSVRKCSIYWMRCQGPCHYSLMWTNLAPLIA